MDVDAAGAFTLVSVQTDDEDDGDHEGIGEDHGRVEVHGAITQLGDGTITVQSHGGSPVTCAVPAGTDLSGFKVTDRVEMKCANVNGTLTLAAAQEGRRRTTMTGAMAGTTATSRSRAFSLSGRRRERAAGERIAALFEEHGRMVYGVCRLMLRDPVEAEDAAQQTFLALRRAARRQGAARAVGVAGDDSRNECRTRPPARRTEPLTLVREPVGDELQREVDRHDEIQALCAALAELPPQQRDAIVLREFYGLSYAEVGAALGLSGAAVESVIFRSRKRLQEQLRPARSALGVLTLPAALPATPSPSCCWLRRRRHLRRRQRSRVRQVRVRAGSREDRRGHVGRRRCGHGCRGRADARHYLGILGVPAGSRRRSARRRAPSSRGQALAGDHGHGGAPARCGASSSIGTPVRHPLTTIRPRPRPATHGPRRRRASRSNATAPVTTRAPSAWSQAGWTAPAGAPSGSSAVRQLGDSGRFGLRRRLGLGRLRRLRRLTTARAGTTPAARAARVTPTTRRLRRSLAADPQSSCP